MKLKSKQTGEIMEFDALEWVSHSDNMTHSFRELGKNVRHVVQISLDGVLIGRWNSITEAAEATGICRTDIGACCRGERTMAGAFEWKYEEDYEEPKSINEIDVVLDAIGEYCNERSYYSGELEKIKILNIVEEKLKAWKRLKDKGFKFVNRRYENTNQNVFCELYNPTESCSELDEYWDDITLLFGGEDE